jgi:hypothetical protein
MISRYLQLSASSFLLVGLIACSNPSAQNNSQQPPAAEIPPDPRPIEMPENRDLAQLFSHIWRIPDEPSQPQSGSIYIFLPNGTLIEASCVTTYRIGTWTIDKETPNVLQVVEDGELAYTATIVELTNTTLRLQQNVVRINEIKDITLTAIEEEFVCPDLPK